MFKSYFFIVLFFWASVAFAAENEPIGKTKITGDDEVFTAGVELINGKNRLLTSSVTIIEALFGRDPQGTTWFYIGTDYDANGVGAAGDTVRVQIPAATTPIGVVYPAIDVTTTVTAAHVADLNPERALAETICADLEATADFQTAKWNCIVMKDFSGVFINSTLFNEWGERDTWSVTATGTTRVTQAWTKIERRGLPTELARSPNNPRQGILAISGSVSVTPGSISDQFEKHAETILGTDSMAINGSVTPVEFFINCDIEKDIFITELRMYGTDGSMKFGQFLGINSPLTNGILIEIISEGLPSDFSEKPIYKTDDYQNHFAVPVSEFALHVQPSLTLLTAARTYENPFRLRKCGTLPAPDDEIKVTIRDDLTSVLELEFIARGFKKEP